jgi:hypothetical protein
MFEKFLDFIKEDKKINIRSTEEFIKQYNGKTFLNGLYRIHQTNDLKKWNDIIERTFPMTIGKVSVFGYDWLGRHFAIYSETETVILLEPGTGEVFDTCLNFYDFHNIEIPNNHINCLSSEYFKEWYEASNHYILPHNKCVGYKIPLFLNGKDTIENMEVSDMEVYWEIMMPLINLQIYFYSIKIFFIFEPSVLCREFIIHVNKRLSNTKIKIEYIVENNDK